MPCELCGRDAPTRPVLVEGSEFQACSQCARFGKSTVPEVTGRGEVAKRIQAVQQRRAAGPRSVDPLAVQEVLADDFPKRIRRARDRAGMTIDEFADKAGVKRSLMHHIEGGDTRPSDDIARRLEKTFNIKLYERAPADLPQSRPVAEGPQALTLGDLLKDALQKEKE